MPEKYAIVLKQTPGGFWVAEAYLGGRLVAVSHDRYITPHSARKDVSQQIREIELAQQPDGIPSAAAGGVR